MKRTTVYLEPSLLRALKLRSAETERSVSDLVNESLRQTLGDDLEDLESFSARSGDSAFSFELVLRNLKRRGEI